MPLTICQPREVSAGLVAGAALLASRKVQAQLGEPRQRRDALADLLDGPDPLATLRAPVQLGESVSVARPMPISSLELTRLRYLSAQAAQ